MAMDKGMMDRRSFTKLAMGLGAVALGAGALVGTSRGVQARADESTGETVTITDMAGREVTYPKNPQRVFSSSPASEAWLCELVPDRIIGWANKMSDKQLEYYPEEVSDVPLIGGWYGYTEGNAEGIIAEAPDVVISAYNLTSDENIASSVQNADELSTKLGVPVIAVSYDINDIVEVTETLGEWLGVEDRGKSCAEFVQSKFDLLDESLANVPEDAVVSYYYAEDISGLQTEAEDSFHSAVFQRCGLKCALGEDLQMSSFMGMEEVSMEQVISWDPQYIFVYNDNAYDTITTDALWSDITAVQDGNVYKCPSCPQNWFDRSPNPLRVLGCLYTAARCYPDYVTYDLDEQVKDYFKTLYGRDLTDEQVAALYETGTASQGGSGSGSGNADASAAAEASSSK